MIHLVGKHGSQDRVAEMIVALVASQICKQMLDGVIDMILSGNPLVVAAPKGFSILFSAVSRHLCSREYRIGRQKMEGVGRIGLLSSAIIGDDRRIGLYTGDYAHCAPSST